MSTLPTPLREEAEPELGLRPNKLAEFLDTLADPASDEVRRQRVADVRWHVLILTNALTEARRALSLEKQRAARRDTSQEVPPNRHPVAVWWDKHEAPQIRRWDAGGEYWEGDNGTFSRRSAFVQWAHLPA